MGRLCLISCRISTKGSFLWNDARVVSVALTAFEVDSDDDDLTLNLSIEQQGDMIIGAGTGVERKSVCLSPRSRR